MTTLTRLRWPARCAPAALRAAQLLHWGVLTPVLLQPFGPGTVVSSVYNGGQVRNLASFPALRWPRVLPGTPVLRMRGLRQAASSRTAQAAAPQNDHALHYTKFGPDGYLYANQGAPSNTGPCGVYSAGGAAINECSIIRMLPDGSDVSTYAFGVRNSVGAPLAPCRL